MIVSNQILSSSPSRIRKPLLCVSDPLNPPTCSSSPILSPPHGWLCTCNVIIFLWITLPPSLLLLGCCCFLTFSLWSEDRVRRPSREGAQQQLFGSMFLPSSLPFINNIIIIGDAPFGCTFTFRICNVATDGDDADFDDDYYDQTKAWRIRRCVSVVAVDYYYYYYGCSECNTKLGIFNICSPFVKHVKKRFLYVIIIIVVV